MRLAEDGVPVARAGRCAHGSTFVRPSVAFGADWSMRHDRRLHGMTRATPQVLSWTKQATEGFMGRFQHSIVGKAFTLALIVVAAGACAMLFAAVAGAATKASPFSAATASM